MLLGMIKLLFIFWGKKNNNKKITHFLPENACQNGVLDFHFCFY